MTRQLRDYHEIVPATHQARQARVTQCVRRQLKPRARGDHPHVPIGGPR